MEQQAYYRILDFDVPDKKSNDCESTERPLIVNCTGLYKMTASYLTNIPKGRQDYYLQYCIEGTIAITAGEKSFVLNPGQMLIIPPRTSYTCRNLDSEVTYYWVHFTGSDAGDLLLRNELECCAVHNVGTGERLVRLFRALFREFLWRDKSFDDAAPACLITVFAEMSRMQDLSTRNSDATVESVFRSLSYFHNCLHKPVTVAQLAEIEHFSPSRYRAVFRRCMGMSPSEYMTRIRMRRACELLAMADLSVREVAEACGYPDQLYFSRVFRAHFGIAPSKYRGETDGKTETDTV